MWKGVGGSAAAARLVVDPRPGLANIAGRCRRSGSNAHFTQALSAASLLCGETLPGSREHPRVRTKRVRRAPSCRLASLRLSASWIWAQICRSRRSLAVSGPTSDRIKTAVEFWPHIFSGASYSTEVRPKLTRSRSMLVKPRPWIGRVWPDPSNSALFGRNFDQSRWPRFLRQTGVER